ncbi:MAG: TetR/AcrR family transcriptional regulator [Emcibacteraceae bacterium]|nr:TetR/AcrR family transcriptional regulator [Emcibacteraceae bacterium]MDG1859336.1 TetR/AcrR family transcriptional regulator [Emcibacteraceae bacterium]
MSESKKTELIEKALKAYYAGGFQAVGMDRLARETGISKTSMYKHFRKKEDLILEVLSLRDEQFRNWFIRRIEEMANNPTDRLLAIFDALGEWFEEEGFLSCMFIRASCEYLNHEDPIHKASANHKRLLLAYVIGLAEQAGIKNPGVLARQLMLLKEGAIVLAHLQGPTGVSDNAKSAASDLIMAASKA